MALIHICFASNAISSAAGIFVVTANRGFDVTYLIFSEHGEVSAGFQRFQHFIKYIHKQFQHIRNALVDVALLRQ